MRETKLYRRHPMVSFLYISSMVLGTMLTMHPVLLGVSFVGACLFGIWMEGLSWWKNLRWSLWIFGVEIVVLPCFRHNGVTRLLELDGQAVTLESIVYGFSISMLVITSLAWFRVASMWMDQERLLYLFGTIFPTAGLLLSMIFRFLPMLRRRYRQIVEVQHGMGRKTEYLSIRKKLYCFGKECSTLISWALEHTIETAISMESRGYGVTRRTTFHLFSFRKTDGIWCALFLLLDFIWGIFCVKRVFVTYYFPKILVPLQLTTWIGIGVFTILMGSVLLYEIGAYQIGKEFV